jgi:hypothetical protein
MNRKLTDEDRRAVDLLLDQGANISKGAITQVVPTVSEKRMTAVKKVLALIGQMPAQDPPANLVSKTMRRIQQATPRSTTPAVRPVRRPARPTA